MKKEIFKTIAIVLAFVFVLPLTYGTGFLIGTIQNKHNEENGYKSSKEYINIMTLNVCSWSFDGKDLETRADGIAKTINDNKVDSLGVQEATPYWMTTLNEKLEVIKKHIELAVNEKGENVGIKEMRKHLACYIRNLANASKMREEINKIKTNYKQIDLRKKAS